MRLKQGALLAGMIAAPLVALGLAWLATRPPSSPTPPPPPLPSRTPPSPPPPSAAEALVQSRCGTCHPPVDPTSLSKNDWLRSMGHMRWLLRVKAGISLPDEEWQILLRTHQEKSPSSLPRLAPDPADSPLPFERLAIGQPAGPSPQITHVKIVDLDQDGRLDVLVCDAEAGSLSLLRRDPDRWKETVLARPGPSAHVEVLDVNGDRRLDLVVAVLGHLRPSDDKVGKVVLLINEGEDRYTSRTLLEGVGRVADVQPADLDRDGDVDFAVAVFGYVLEGQVGWLEQKKKDDFVFHPLLAKPGAVHVPVADLDGDGAPDFAALVSQQTEEIVAFLNDGKARFEPRTLHRAGSAVFGSSGLQLVDLDRDGDLDALFTNGDAFDLPEPDLESGLRPYNGVQWLENRGRLDFAYRDLRRFYGCYAAAAGDLDGDGDLDVVAVSASNDWADTSRRSILWLENDGRQNFTAHGIDGTPTNLATVALGDLDQDGRLDIVAGTLQISAPAARPGRVTLWRNSGR